MRCPRSSPCPSHQARRKTTDDHHREQPDPHPHAPVPAM
jgi:hypothetical protein